jgi:uncharacterized Zn-finger protein
MNLLLILLIFVNLPLLTMEDEFIQDPLEMSDKSWTCDFNNCNKSYKSKSSLVKHMKKHLGDEERIHKCNQCDKSFFEKSDLNKHFKTHSDVRNFHCNICKESFKDSYTLMCHEKTHNDIKDFKCSYCNKEYRQKQTLNDHVQKEHFHQVKIFICQLCTKEYESQQGLDYHISQHNNKRSFVCTICKKGFNTNNILKSHMNIHTSTLIFTCEVCGHKCNTPTDEKPPFVCSFENCKKTFDKKGYLTRHENRHKKIKAKDNLIDESIIKKQKLCTLNIAKSLQQNEMSYFECNLCQLKFNSGDEFQMHKNFCNKSLNQFQIGSVIDLDNGITRCNKLPFLRE